MAKFNDADRTLVECGNCSWRGSWWVNHKCPKCKSPDLKAIGAPLYTLPEVDEAPAPEPTGETPPPPPPPEPTGQSFTPASEVFAMYDDEGRPRKKRKWRKNYGGTDPGN